MKKLLFFFTLPLLFSSCHESFEDRVYRETKEFTEKMCPTPVNNNTRVDSIVFDKSSRTVNYYHTFVGPADNKQSIDKNKQYLIEVLRKAVRDNVDQKAYKEAKFPLHYVYHSEKEPQLVLLDVTFTTKDYAK